MAPLVSTFESASRFEGANESSAQTTILIDIVALSCRTFSFVHMLVDYAFGAAILIAYGDCDGGDEDGRDGARSAVKSGGCCAAKITPPCKSFALRVLQHPLRPAKQFPKTESITERSSGSGSGGHGRLSQIQEARSPLEGGSLDISCKFQQSK